MQPSCLASLERSHLRHAEVMSKLLAAARRLADGLDADHGELSEVSAGVEYLHRSVPRHFLDEEQSLFPRLERRMPELGAALSKLVAEHAVHRRLHERIAEASSELAQGARPGAATRLLEAVRELAALYEAHAGQEDEYFVLAARVLSPSELLEIEDEMERRRAGGGGGGGRGGGGGGGGGGG
ncbi:MAG TPA: hemerythrin domain-containing protein, partial [Kofleriaceae bacterium]|nr:hemerythrin domain-containing protein [Kofleriaceae bacterium]